MMRWSFLTAGAAFLIWLGFVTPVHAAQTVPYKLNYQGRLTDTSGSVKTDGSYNMRFRIFSVVSGGSALWTETRDVAGGNGVALKNGMFNVQLGNITALSPSLFASQPLYLEIELPTPGTATLSSPTWTEGPMTPRQLLSSAPYAMNADTVDGIDGASLAQLSANNTFSGNATFSGTFLQQNTSSTAFRVQNAGGTDVLLVDTSSLAVKVGGGDISPDASPTLLVLDYKNTSGDPAGTDGGMYYNSVTKKFRCQEAGAWTDCIPDSHTGYEHHADFLTGGSITDALAIDNTLMTKIVNNTSISRVNGELNHPGILRFNLGTFSGGYVAIASNFDSGNTTAGIKFGGAVWTSTQQVRLSANATAGGGANEFASYNGFIDNQNVFTSSGLQNGCLVFHRNINGGRWVGLCGKNGSSSSTCDPLDASSQLLPAIATNVWYTLTTIVNSAGTLATFVVEGNNTIGTCTLSTNIPTTTLTSGVGLLRVSGTGSGITADYDFVETKGTGFVRY